MRSIILMIISIFTIGFLIFGSYKINYANEQIIECTIKDKWIKRTSSKSNDKYLVSCDDDVYQITDLMWIGKFNSADIYSNLEVNKKYKIYTSGYRNGFFSMYKNINSYEELREGE